MSKPRRRLPSDRILILSATCAIAALLLQICADWHTGPLADDFMLASGGFLALFFDLMFLSLLLAGREHHRRCTATVTGLVTEIRSEGVGLNRSHTPIVIYHVNDHRYRTRANRTRPPRKIGDEVTVHYDPHHPAHACTYMESRRTLVVLTVITAILALVAIAFFVAVVLI